MNAEYDYLIIGGGIAGVTAAETIRTRDQEGRIAVISSEKHPLYSRVLLPAYLKGKIPRERVFLRTREDFAAKRIDFHLGQEVVSVDSARREAETAGGRVFGFGKLLIASGGRVKRWLHQEAAGDRACPRASRSAGAYRLQTMDDADRLLGDMPRIREPLVIGSSFIALEFIEIFIHNNIIPRVFARDKRFFEAFTDEAGGQILEDNFKRHGVICMYGEEISDIAARGTGLEIASAHSGLISADSIAIGIGVERNISFLHNSGITLGRRGVKTDEYLETNVSGIYAAGDVAEYYDLTFGGHHTAGNWTHAVAQGSRAGLNMTGDCAAFTYIPSYSITNLGMRLAAIGECGAGLSAIARVNKAEAQYERLFLRDGVMVGAFLINRLQDRPHITTLISQRADIGAYENQLRDMAFDIHAISLVT